MKSARLKPGFLKVHRWIGLVAGLFVLIQGLTGSLIAFRPELNRILHPAMIVTPVDHPVLLARMIKTAQAAMPGFKVTRTDYPRRPDDAYLLRLAGKGGALTIVTMDGAGHVTRAAPLSGWPVEWAYQIHIGTLYGGEPMIGYVGLALIVMALTGLYVWWPLRSRFKGAFRVATDTPARATRDLHRFLGTALSPVLLVMALTGLTMAWTEWMRPAVALVLPFSPDTAPRPPKKPCARNAPIDDDVAAAIAKRPGQTVKSVRVQAKGRIVAVYFQSPIAYPARITDHVWVNACTAEVMVVNDQAQARAGNWLFNWLLPIHSGEWLGLPGRLLSWTAALSLIFMSMTGYVLWVIRAIQRKHARATRKARQ